MSDENLQSEEDKSVGRPAYERNETHENIVLNLSFAGKTQNQIAKQIGIDAKTLRKYYREELEKGKSKRISDLTGKAYEMAMNGNASLLMFLLKTQGGYSDKKNDDDDKDFKKDYSELDKNEKQNIAEEVSEMSMEDKLAMITKRL